MCGAPLPEKADACRKCDFPITLVRIAGVMRNHSQRKDADAAFQREMQLKVDEAQRRSLKDFEPLRAKVAGEARDREHRILDHERAIAQVAMQSAIALRWTQPCPHCNIRGAVASRLMTP